ARQISHHGDTLAAVAGRDFRITVVSARSRDADRGFDITGIDWVDNAAEIAERDDVDIVVEMIGGEEGVALDLVTRALETGKHVIT
ncbi:MAG: homoserine dehydrogenase, partial [Pseudomonadota bacterium]|nr:homoserine dehydrogenase [Pseudomonadota bacterium]